MTHVNQILETIPQAHITKEMLMLHMLNYLTHEGKLLALLISDHGSPTVQNQVKKVLKENALKNMLDHINVKIDSDIEKKYFIAYFSNAWFGILQEWINGGQRGYPESLVNIANKIIKFDLM